MKVSTKLILSILIFGLLFFLGGKIIRSTIAYDLFEPNTQLELKKSYTESEQLQTLRLYSMSSFYVLTGFSICFVCIIALNINLRKHLKTKGWVFMAIVLFYLASIVELYLGYFDFNLAWAFQYYPPKSFNDNIITEYFLVPIRKYSVASGLAFLAELSCILFIVWKPLDNKVLNETN